jgi:phage I-like protein
LSRERYCLDGTISKHRARTVWVCGEGCLYIHQPKRIEALSAHRESVSVDNLLSRPLRNRLMVASLGSDPSSLGSNPSSAAMKAIIRTGVAIEVDSMDEAKKIADSIDQSVMQAFEVEANYLGLTPDEDLVKILPSTIDLI